MQIISSKDNEQIKYIKKTISIEKILKNILHGSKFIDYIIYLCDYNSQ